MGGLGAEGSVQADTMAVLRDTIPISYLTVVSDTCFLLGLTLLTTHRQKRESILALPSQMCECVNLASRDMKRLLQGEIQVMYYIISNPNEQPESGSRCSGPGRAGKLMTFPRQSLRSSPCSYCGSALAAIWPQESRMLTIAFYGD